MIARNRERGGRPVPKEIDDLYTDACAMVLELESERMDLDRRLTGAPTEAGRDNLARRRTELIGELRQLRVLTTHLSTASEWMREPESAQVDELTG